MDFKIGKRDFLVDGKAEKLVAGALHYFRLVDGQWEDSLYNLKAMGCNAVETIVPWNFHEAHQGHFDFETGNHNIAKFIQIAQDLGLYVIVRPSPYICGEWEFGGFPYWMLKDRSIRLRSSDPKFIASFKEYYDRLFEILVPLQTMHGGPIIMMQVENEYGSFGNDKDYLRILYHEMINRGVEVPIFTSDGGWDEALEAGTLTEPKLLPTANFGSRSKQNIDALKTFMDRHDIEGPLMCMEFWSGWFNRWGEEIIRRDATELLESIEEMLDLGSINLYMFQGGTNFGFMNGASARGTMDLHQVTSYDYDVFLTEWGEPRDKFYMFQDMMKRKYGMELPEPRIRSKRNYGSLKLVESTSLFDTVKTLATPIYSKWTLPMEHLNQGYGYTLYHSNIGKKRTIDRVKVVDASDRVQVYLNKNLEQTQIKKEIGTEFSLDLQAESNEMHVLVENMGRVNYGHRFIAPTQNKGIRNGVMLDLHFHAGWDHYALDLHNIDKVDYSTPYNVKGPGFFKFELNADVCEDTFIDMKGFGKGAVFVNGFNLGRYWHVGPINYLYLPGSLLKQGKNEIVVFETEGINTDELVLRDHPVYVDAKAITELK